MVSYLQLAHNERHPRTGSPVAKVIHSFGRADKVDRAALARLVGSISRFLDPVTATAAAAAGEVEVIDSRRMGAAWVLGRLWDRLEIGTAIRRAAAGRRLDGDATERVIFAHSSRSSVLSFERSRGLMISAARAPGRPASDSGASVARFRRHCGQPSF